MAKFYDGHSEHYDRPATPAAEVPPAGTEPPHHELLHRRLTALASSPDPVLPSAAHRALPSAIANAPSD